MKNIFNITVAVLIASRISILAVDAVSPTNRYAPAPPNVLMIVIDDLVGNSNERHSFQMSADPYPDPPRLSLEVQV